jgi:hypothetical protein
MANSLPTKTTNTALFLTSPDPNIRANYTKTLPERPTCNRVLQRMFMGRPYTEMRFWRLRHCIGRVELKMWRQLSRMVWYSAVHKCSQIRSDQIIHMRTCRIKGVCLGPTSCRAAVWNHVVSLLGVRDHICPVQTEDRLLLFTPVQSPLY